MLLCGNFDIIDIGNAVIVIFNLCFGLQSYSHLVLEGGLWRFTPMRLREQHPRSACELIELSYLP